MTALDRDALRTLATLLPGREKSAASRPVEQHLRALQTLMHKNRRSDTLWKRVLSAINTLGEEELEQLARLIIALLAARKKYFSQAQPGQPQASKASEGTAVVEKKEKRATIRVEYRKCGKNCHCNGGRGHGPYRYMYWWENGRLRSRYLERA